MPYIEPHRRLELEISLASAFQGMTAGELNWVVTMLMADWLRENGTNYRNLNTVVGALECAKLELYRRVAAPYEDVKIKENGDVYE